MTAHQTPGPGKKTTPRVPTYRILHSFTKPTPVSLLDRIAVAKSAQEVDKLLAEGAGYEHASPGTRRRWARVAAEKKRILSTTKTEEKKS